MKPITYIDRQSGRRVREAVYGEAALRLLYGDSWWSRLVGSPLRYCASRFPFVSALYGWWQHQSFTAKKVQPFIDAYGVESNEFLDPTSSFRSFNDFFIRKLKRSVRPIAPGRDIAVMPADARYLFFPELSSAQLIDVKGKRLDLAQLLQDPVLAKRYEGGSLVMARLCPSDYHRFHFPVDCVPSVSQLINGYLYSVNPVAIQRNIGIFSENRRMLCKLATEAFGEVLYIEVGATNVGSIQETYTPNIPQPKGAEKGYFAFGGSALLILFLPGVIRFDEDLLAATREGLEVRCLLGQPMGKASAAHGA